MEGIGYVQGGERAENKKGKEDLMTLLVARSLLRGVLITDIVDWGLVLLQNAVRLDHPDRIRGMLAQPT